MYIINIIVKHNVQGDIYENLHTLKTNKDWHDISTYDGHLTDKTIKELKQHTDFLAYPIKELIDADVVLEDIDNIIQI